MAAAEDADESSLPEATVELSGPIDEVAVAVAAGAGAGGSSDGLLSLPLLDSAEDVAGGDRDSGLLFGGCVALGRDWGS